MPAKKKPKGKPVSVLTNANPIIMKPAVPATLPASLKIVGLNDPKKSNKPPVTVSGDEYVRHVENPTEARDFLRKSEKIMVDRGKEYDSPQGERSMGKTITAFNAITGRDLKESEGWLLLELLKNVRQWTTALFHRDSAEDGVTYSALKAEALAREQAQAKG